MYAGVWTRASCSANLTVVMKCMARTRVKGRQSRRLNIKRERQQHPGIRGHYGMQSSRAATTRIAYILRLT